MTAVGRDGGVKEDMYHKALDSADGHNEVARGESVLDADCVRVEVASGESELDMAFGFVVVANGKDDADTEFGYVEVFALGECEDVVEGAEMRRRRLRAVAAIGANLMCRNYRMEAMVDGHGDEATRGGCVAFPCWRLLVSQLLDGDYGGEHGMVTVRRRIAFPSWRLCLRGGYGTEFGMRPWFPNRWRRRRYPTA